MTSSSPFMHLESFLGLFGDQAPGSSVRDFEAALSQYIDAGNCFAVSSGRLGLYLIIKSLGLGEGTKVLMSALNFHVVPTMVRSAGLEPIFADVDAETLNMEPGEVERRIGPDTSAVLVTHMFGQPCDIDALVEICRDRGVALIEDCAHAFGADVGGRKVGSFGDASFFSFETVKHINTYGGGMVVLKSDSVAGKFAAELAGLPPTTRRRLARKIVFSCIEHFLSRPIFFSLTVSPLLSIQYALGGDETGLVQWYKKRKRRRDDILFQYSDLQARAGMKQLPPIDALNEQRRRNARLLTEKLTDVVSMQKIPKNTNPAHYLYVIAHREPGALIKELFRNGIDASGHVMDYCPPLFRRRDDCPVARELSAGLVQIPFGPALSPSKINRLAAAVTRSAKKVNRDHRIDE
ncbi:DegT/DnrJ/EryC1/StrS family aminotransferase [Thermodesulfobacteriota bacterium]